MYKGTSHIRETSRRATFAFTQRSTTRLDLYLISACSIRYERYHRNIRDFKAHRTYPYRYLQTDYSQVGKNRLGQERAGRRAFSAGEQRDEV
jgi:hypothetical protein